jgi:mannose-6-phosphate isomerase-like protein (cupin superfamily)
MEKVSLCDKLALFDDYWSPRIVGELNGQYVKVAKLRGEFVWHNHEAEDELFLVVEGSLVIRLRDRDIALEEGEFCIVPRGVDHKPVAQKEASILLFEPKSTSHTGAVHTERTQDDLEWI